MDSHRLKELLAFWIPLVAAANVAYSFYDFEMVYKTDPGSEYGQRQATLEQSKKDLEGLEKRDKEMQEFVKTLDSKRAEFAAASGRLMVLKSAMSDRVDVPEFMKLIVTEAKKTGLTVLSIKPRSTTDQEYYREYPFEFRFKGVFSQLFTFLNRVSSLQRTVKVDELAVKPASSAAAKFVELEGELVFKTFAYSASKEDNVAKQGGQPGGAPGEGGGR